MLQRAGWSAAASNTIVSFVRYAKDPANAVVMVFNFTPVPRYGYRIGVPERGAYVELLNSDAALFGGGDIGNAGQVQAEAVPLHGFQHSVALTVPPLGCLLLKRRP